MPTELSRAGSLKPLTREDLRRSGVRGTGIVLPCARVLLVDRRNSSEPAPHLPRVE